MIKLNFFHFNIIEVSPLFYIIKQKSIEIKNNNNNNSNFNKNRRVNSI